jgi:hypothetical protein
MQDGRGRSAESPALMLVVRALQSSSGLQGSTDQLTEVLWKFHGDQGGSGSPEARNLGRRTDSPAVMSGMIPATAGAVVEDGSRGKIPGIETLFLRSSGGVGVRRSGVAAAQGARWCSRGMARLARVLGLNVVVRQVSRGAAGWFKEGGIRISACAPDKEGRRASRAGIAAFGCECAARGR